MSMIYDRWGKLVGAVLRKEKDRHLAYCESIGTCSSSDLSSRVSLDLHLQDGLQNANAAASTGGDVENQKASSVLPHDMGKQIAPRSSEEPTSQKEASEDRDKDKRSESITEVIAMLLGIKATLMRLNKLDHDNLMPAAAKESPDEAELPTTSSAIDDEVEEVRTALKGRSNMKSSRKLDSNRLANTQTKRPSAAQQKMAKTLVNDVTKSGDDEPEGQQNVLDHGESANMKDEQSPQVGEVQESGGIEDLEELMDPLGFPNALGLENWNEVLKRLVVETSGLLQELMKTNKGMRRHTTDTSKAIYVDNEFEEQQPDIDDDDEFQSPPQETDERSAEEKTTENSGSLHKGKNVPKRPPTTKHTKTLRRGPNRLAEAPLQHAGKPMSSIKDDDAREEDQNVLQEEKVNYDDNDGKEDTDFPQEESSVIGDEAGEEESEPEHEQELVNNDDEMGKEEGNMVQEWEQKHKVGDESGEIRDQWQEKQLNLSREKQKTVMKSAKHTKLGKSDLNRSAVAQTQSHLAESMTQKMSYDPHAVLEDKPDFIDEDAMEEEYEKEKEGIMRSTNFESLLERKREMAVGKKRVSPQLQQLKATMSSVATLVGVGEFLEQEMVNDIDADVEEEDQNLVLESEHESFLKECKNSESQVMRPVEKKKRAVAPTTKQRLSKPQLQAQLHGKANRAISSSVKSVAFQEQIGQKILPDDDNIGEVDEEAEEEEEVSVTTEEVSHSTSV